MLNVRYEVFCFHGCGMVTRDIVCRGYLLLAGLLVLEEALVLCEFLGKHEFLRLVERAFVRRCVEEERGLIVRPAFHSLKEAFASVCWGDRGDTGWAEGRGGGVVEQANGFSYSSSYSSTYPCLVP